MLACDAFQLPCYDAEHTAYTDIAALGPAHLADDFFDVM